MQVAVASQNLLTALRTFTLISLYHATHAIVTVCVLIDTDHPGNSDFEIVFLFAQSAF